MIDVHRERWFEKDQLVHDRAKSVSLPTFEECLKLYYPKDSKEVIAILAKWVVDVCEAKAAASKAGKVASSPSKLASGGSPLFKEYLGLLGVAPLINAQGHITTLGGSRSRPRCGESRRARRRTRESLSRSSASSASSRSTSPSTRSPRCSR